MITQTTRINTRSGKYVSCPVCQKLSYRYPSQVKKYNSYCSKKCWYSAMPRRLAEDTKYRESSIQALNKNRLNRNYRDIGFRKKNSDGVRKAYSEGRLKTNFPVMYGENNPAWKGGTTEENTRIRTSARYKEWRKIVLNRDNYTCQICLVRGGVLEVDHIKPFSLYPKLRFNIDNGRTLCTPCHMDTDTYAGKLNRN